MKRQFEFCAGSLSLDFIDTVARRATDPTDLFDEPEDLKRWLSQAGLLDSAPIRDCHLHEAKRLRNTIYKLMLSVVDDRALPPAAIGEINAVASLPDLRPQFKHGAVVHCSADASSAALSTIAADAINNLRPEFRARLRQCPDCGMLFRDNSRPGRRKWCSSKSGCGNRAKVRRHRANRRGD